MTKSSEFFAGILNSGKRVFTGARNHKKLTAAIVTSFLLVVAIVSVVAARKNSGGGGDSSAALTATSSISHAILRSSCSATRYPELCFSMIAAEPSLAEKLTSQKEVIEASINISLTAVEHAFFKIEKLLKTRRGLSRREKTALHDCLEDIDETLDELREAYEDVKVYPSKKSLSQQAEDLKILLSAAMTNQDSCIDGFSHDEANKNVREVILKSLTHVYHMCSNSLAMICNMTDTHMAMEKAAEGRRLDELDQEGFPSWLSAGDRRLLQSSSVTPDVVVAADGSGDYTTVAAAVAAAPDRSSRRYVIRIKAGVYRENVEVPKKKTNIMFMGDGRRNTIITGSRNVVDGSTTFRSATVDPFLALGLVADEFSGIVGPVRRGCSSTRRVDRLACCSGSSRRPGP
ncbi:hypothetical protein ACLOJK_000929 [Asimina triloba]